ncbi:PDR/VanB family oxidoreductase [Paraburkholderia acidisoli]|uniref:Carnitine monooxygenase reductase subunit n=1 Tax=Paraburkholderia acidisoli TaxID=2571748 RepID=A0A7Z2JKQ9_9BURK|nr:PDR/VanB family oxidoreductase [Paraburkholderia acidisoli]QGZ66710.1 2Fe-2S iron-sulfur cluster binding domain-containing protein [Paraburkholderia acidisoli]
MNARESMTVDVVGVETLTPLIKRYTLALPDGAPLPSFTGGAHVLVSMQDGDVWHHNAYSLLGSPHDTRRYQIAVRREAVSRGGSAFMHEQVRVGTRLAIGTPANLFELARDARDHVFIAGGIGITPFLAHLAEHATSDLDLELHYAYRSPEHGAFVSELREHPRAAHVHCYADSAGPRLDLLELFKRLQRERPAAHVYVCGPQGLNDAVYANAALLGWPKAQLHSEQFAATDTAGQAFTVVLAKSGLEVTVGEDETILKAIERAGVSVESLCREGVCGTCEVPILEGRADHRDQYLDEDEKAAQKTVLLCVSRALTPRLVIDL